MQLRAPHVYCTHCRTIVRDGEGVRGPAGGLYCTEGCREWLKAKNKRNGYSGPRLASAKAQDVKAWLLAGQEYRCPVCQLPLQLDQAVLDHDHGCDKDDPRGWRGVIHGECNTGIGKLGDDLPGALRAVQYLATRPRYWFIPQP